MELSESQTEDKSWQQTCDIFQQSEQQFLINSEFKQEQENKIWQKSCGIFDRECMQKKQEDVFGTLIKQVEENRNPNKKFLRIQLRRLTNKEISKQCSNSRKPEKHKNVSKAKDKVHVCEICEKKFGYKHSLEIHISGVHEENRPHKCKICNKSFKQLSNLLTHISGVHERKKPVKCTQCKVFLANYLNLKLHIKAVHEKQKPFQCVVCPSSFSDKRNLTRHISSIHEKIPTDRDYQKYGYY